MNNAETNLQVFMEVMRVNTRPILLVNFSDSLFGDEDFKVIKQFQEQFSYELDILLASKTDRNLYAREFDLGGYPVFLLFYQGKEVSRFLGKATVGDLEQFYTANILHKTKYNMA